MKLLEFGHDFGDFGIPWRFCQKKKKVWVYFDLILKKIKCKKGNFCFLDKNLTIRTHHCTSIRNIWTIYNSMEHLPSEYLKNHFHSLLMYKSIPSNRILTYKIMGNQGYKYQIPCWKVFAVIVQTRLKYSPKILSLIHTYLLLVQWVTKV